MTLHDQVAKYASVREAARHLGIPESTLRGRLKQKPATVHPSAPAGLPTDARVLVIGDIHEPVARPGYLEFCKDLYKKWDCDTVVFIGDIVDWHGISFHAKHPDAPGATDEYTLALDKVQRWYKAFPKAYVCIGNHDERVVRLASSVGIPSKMLRDYSDVWNTPGWTWGTEFTIDDVYYFHGTGNGGMYPAANVVKKVLMSVVIGHNHTAAGVKWFANPTRRIFGLDTGCGIDDKAYAFAYGKHMKQRSVLGAGIVLNGKQPYHEIMPIGPGEAYHRSNFPEHDLLTFV